MNPMRLNDDDGVDEIPADIPVDGHLRYLLTAYLFESISEAGRKEVESHLAGCADCRRELDELRETVGLVKEALHLPPGAAPYSFEERRVQRVLERAGRGPRKRFWSRKTIVALAATVLIAGMIRFFGVTLMSARGKRELAYYSKSPASQNAAPGLAEFTPAGDFRRYAAPETAAEPAVAASPSRPAAAPAPAQNEPAVALQLGDVNQDGAIELALTNALKPGLQKVAPGSGGGGGGATLAAGGKLTELARGAVKVGIEISEVNAQPAPQEQEALRRKWDVVQADEGRAAGRRAGAAAPPGWTPVPPASTAPRSQPRTRFAAEAGLLSAPEPGAVAARDFDADTVGDRLAVESLEGLSDRSESASVISGVEKERRDSASAPAHAAEESEVSGSGAPAKRSGLAFNGRRSVVARGETARARGPAKREVQKLAQATDFLATKPADDSRLNKEAAGALSQDAERSLARAEGATREKKLSENAQGWSFAEQTKGANTTDYGLLFGGVAGAPAAGPDGKADDKKLGALKDNTLNWDVAGAPPVDAFAVGSSELVDGLAGKDKGVQVPGTITVTRADPQKPSAFGVGLYYNAPKELDAEVNQKKHIESVSAEIRFDDQQKHFFEQLGIDGVSANQGLNTAEGAAPIHNLVMITNISGLSPGDGKNLASRVSETQLRSWYFYKAADPTLRPDVFWKRRVVVPRPEPGDEGLGQEEFRKKYGVHPFVETARDRVSTFGMDVDTASYTLARALLAQGKLPDQKTVRVEEWVNSFREEVEADPKSVFTVHTEGGPSPYGIGLEMLKVTVKARELKPSERKSAVLTFAIDASGSMALEKRLALLKDSLRTLVNSLGDDDRVAIVAFGANASLVLPHTRAAERGRILGAIDALAASGGTNVEAGLDLAYRLADENLDPRAVNRVLLASDGVANVGSRGPEDILTKVRVFAGRGIYLSCVGFGGGRYNDAMLETLSKRGNGNYAYVDSVETARALFETNLPSTLQVLAADAKIQVEFNPESVTRYRLLGYERRDIADKDFRNDKIDAGEVGPGSTVTVLYEIQRRAVGSGELATVRMRYRDVGTGRVEEEERSVQQGVLAARQDETSPRFRFIASVAEAAELLRGSYWARDGSHERILEVLATLDAGYQAREEVKAFGDLVIQARDATLKTLLTK